MARCGSGLMIDFMRANIDIRKWYLYVITDTVISHGLSHLEIAERALAGGADVIQLRDKAAGSRELYEVGRQLRELTRAHKVPFIVNDRLDIALAVDADGLHVGQDDLPAPITRRLLGPDKILGVSARNLSEALQACQEGADYLGVGPIFEARQTKADAGEPAGIQLIEAVRHNCPVPIVAIGGIHPGNAAQVIQAGADSLAVISAIVAAKDIQGATRDFKQLILDERGI